MSIGILCRQAGCSAYASFRYTWPGRDESAICLAHSAKLAGIASAMGLHVQLVPLTAEDHEDRSLQTRLNPTKPNDTRSA